MADPAFAQFKGGFLAETYWPVLEREGFFVITV